MRPRTSRAGDAPGSGASCTAEVALNPWSLVLLCLVGLAPAALAAPPPERLLADASRRVERGDHEGALERLERIADAELEPADEAHRQRVAAEAHRAAALERETVDPARHLTLAVEAHQACVAAQGKGTAPHVRYCERHQDELLAAVQRRAQRIATTLELGGAASSTELQERCDMLATLAPDTPHAARCLARLGWARADGSVADAAYAKALALPASETRDSALAQAASTHLHLLGDVDATRALLERGPASPGPSLARLVQALADFEAKLLPRREAAYAGEDPTAWYRWIKALVESGLFSLAVTEAEVARERATPDARLLLTLAAARTQAAAALPEGGDEEARIRRIRALYAASVEDLDACAALEDTLPACAQTAERLRGRIAEIDTRK